MRALVLGSDFIKTANGDIKLLEVNTNTGVLAKGVPFLNFSPLENLITTNGFTEVHLIFNDRNFLSPYKNYRKDENSFYSKIKSICENLNIAFNEYLVESYAVTVPFIEDSESKLIIRLAYDTTAIIDSDYTSDKASFLNLFHSKEYIPKHYTQDVNNIGTDPFSYSGNEPNFIAKSRINMDDRTEWPRLYNIQNESELSSLKSGINTSDYFLQEYVVSDEINDKLNIIRSIDIVYGGNLDMIHLGSYKVLNVFKNTPDNTIDEERKYSKKDRPKYITYTQKRQASFAYIIDGDSQVWMGDGTKKIATDLVIDDVIKTIIIPELPINEGDYSVETWTGSVSDFISNYTIETTVVKHVEFAEEERLFLKITTNNGKVWHDLPHSDVLIKEGDRIRFRVLEDLEVGDIIYFVNSETNEVSEDVVASMEAEWKTITIGTLDVEPSDLFLPFVDEGTYTLIQHNLCKTYCKTFKPCPNYQSPNCNQCSGIQCGGSK